MSNNCYLSTRARITDPSQDIEVYRKLDETEIAIINELKAFGNQILNVLDDVEEFRNMEQRDIDLRWHAIARTDFQTGLMALIRSIAQPGGL